MAWWKEKVGVNLLNILVVATGEQHSPVNPKPLSAMARQAGPIFFTGTLDDITFYKMEGLYYARKKSSLDKKRFRTDPRFKRSRASADRFGEASRLASEVYQLLPKEARGKGVIGKLTAQVGQLLKEGKDPIQIIAHFQPQHRPKATKPASPLQEKNTAIVQTTLSTWKIVTSGELIIESPGHNQNLIGTSLPPIAQTCYCIQLLE